MMLIDLRWRGRGFDRALLTAEIAKGRSGWGGDAKRLPARSRSELS